MGKDDSNIFGSILLLFLLIISFGATVSGLYFGGYKTIKDVIDYCRSSSWREVSAVLEEIRLDTSHSGNRVNHHLYTRYSYTWEGQGFKSSSATFYDDNFVRIYDKETFHRLKDILNQYETKTIRRSKNCSSLIITPNNHKPIKCLVNPSNPGEAFLFREFRLGQLLFQLMYMVLMGGIGGIFTLLFLSPFFGNSKEAKAGSALNP